VRSHSSCRMYVSGRIGFNGSAGLALGARAQQVLQLILGQGLVVILIGSATGGVLAVTATRLLAAWLFGVSPFDPLRFLLAMTILFSLVLLASYIPAPCHQNRSHGGRCGTSNALFGQCVSLHRAKVMCPALLPNSLFADDTRVSPNSFTHSL